MNPCRICGGEAVTFALVSILGGPAAVMAVCFECADENAVIGREKVPR